MLVRNCETGPETNGNFSMHRCSVNPGFAKQDGTLRGSFSMAPLTSRSFITKHYSSMRMLELSTSRRSGGTPIFWSSRRHLLLAKGLEEIPGCFPTRCFPTRPFPTRHFSTSDISLPRRFSTKTFPYQDFSLPRHFPTSDVS
jgi:hypothetical protein